MITISITNSNRFFWEKCYYFLNKFGNFVFSAWIFRKFKKIAEISCNPGGGVVYYCKIEYGMIERLGTSRSFVYVGTNLLPAVIFR